MCFPFPLCRQVTCKLTSAGILVKSHTSARSVERGQCWTWSAHVRSHCALSAQCPVTMVHSHPLAAHVTHKRVRRKKMKDRNLRKKRGLDME